MHDRPRPLAGQPPFRLVTVSGALCSLNKYQAVRLNMSSTGEHGGKREGAGRPRGSVNRRSLEAIEEVAARFPDWSPLSHCAAVANDESLPVDVRLDAAKAALPYVHPRLKGVDRDPEAAIEIERRISEARASAFAKHLPLDALADRLARASREPEIEHAELARLRALERRILDAEAVQPTDDRHRLHDRLRRSDPTPVSAPSSSAEAGQVGRAQPPLPAPPTPAPATDWQPRTEYRPILPWPDKDEGRVEVEYDLTDGSYDNS